jgi:hypothetical protein
LKEVSIMNVNWKAVLLGMAWAGLLWVASAALEAWFTMFLFEKRGICPYAAALKTKKGTMRFKTGLRARKEPRKEE